MSGIAQLAFVATLAFVDLPTLTFDAVEAVKGNTIAGKDSITTEYGRFRYQFSSDENRETFRADPEKYEVQFGGACLRMGPLGSTCRTDIFAVYDSRLYLFASKQCREAFLKAPEKMLEGDEPPPAGDAESIAKGRKLLDRAVRAIGTEGALAKLETYRETTVRNAKEKSEQPDRSVRTWKFSGAYREDDTWGKSTYSMYVTGPGGKFVYPRETWEMVADQVGALRRQSVRHPLVLLKNRESPAFKCAAGGRGKLAGQDVELVTVSLGGATCTLGIDPESGRIVAMRHRTRGGPRVVMGDVEVRLADFREVDGLVIPFERQTVSFDGTPLDGNPTRLTQVEINPQLDATTFSAKPSD